MSLENCNRFMAIHAQQSLNVKRGRGISENVDVPAVSPPKRLRINLDEPSLSTSKPSSSSTSEAANNIPITTFGWIIENSKIGVASSTLTYFNRSNCERDGQFEFEKIRQADPNTQKYNLIIASAERNAPKVREFLQLIYWFLIHKELAQRTKTFCEACEVSIPMEGDGHQNGCQANNSMKVLQHGKASFESITPARLLTACKIMEGFYYGDGNSVVDENMCTDMISSVNYEEYLNNERWFVAEYEFYKLRQI